MKIPLLAALLALAACRTPQTPAEQALLESDRAFARDTAERRLEGWVAAFDESGSTVDDSFRPITGKAAIRARWQDYFADPANVLEWEPDAIRVSEGGRLGTTTGRYRVLRREADGSLTVLDRGRYFDVWRKQDDGSWKLLYDLGDSDGEP